MEEKAETDFRNFVQRTSNYKSLKVLPQIKITLAAIISILTGSKEKPSEFSGCIKKK